MTFLITVLSFNIRFLLKCFYMFISWHGLSQAAVVCVKTTRTTTLASSHRHFRCSPTSALSLQVWPSEVPALWVPLGVPARHYSHCAAYKPVAPTQLSVHEFHSPCACQHLPFCVWEVHYKTSTLQVQRPVDRWTLETHPLLGCYRALCRISICMDVREQTFLLF